MILVVVLAVAGLAGIAAAFYFSIRSGRRGDNHNSRARAARGLGRLRPGGSTADTGPERPGIGSRAANGGRAANARRANQAAGNFPDDTGLNSTMDFGELALPGVRRAASSRRTGDEADDDAGAAPAAFEADGDDGSRTTRTRRRVGFRKGAEVDEELWPTESFGGVSDEQFWDDLASDKPLTTTARTAQQDSARRTSRAAQRTEPRGRDQTPRFPAAPDRPAAGSRASGTLAADAGAEAGAVSPAESPDQPLIRPAYGATQPVTPLKPAASARSAAPQPAITTLKPVGGTGPLPASARQPGTVNQPGEGRRPTLSSGKDDDPLTSSAFSLREAGPVDGHSLRTTGPARGRDYQPSTAEEGQPPAPGDMGSGGYLPSPPAPGYLAGNDAAPYGTPSSYSPAAYDAASYGAGPYDGAQHGTAQYGTAQYGTGPYDGPARTPPNVDAYGYRSPGPLDEPRRPNGTPPNGVRPNGARPNGAAPSGSRPSARHAGPDDRGRPAAPPSPQQQPGQPGVGRHQSGGYQNGGYQSGGYQANGYPEPGRHGGGHRHPYDPRDDYRRLAPPALTSGRGTGGTCGPGGWCGTGVGR